MQFSLRVVAFPVLLTLIPACGEKVPEAELAAFEPQAETANSSWDATADSEEGAIVEAEAQPRVAPATPPLLLKLRTLQDKGMGNMDSHTVLVPEGWSVEGGGWWAPQAYFNILPSREIVAKSPDGTFVRVAPGMTATDFNPSQYAQQMGMTRAPVGAADNGYPVVYFPKNKSAWKRWIQNEVLPADLPGAKKLRVKKVERVEELQEGLEKMMAPLFQQMEQSNQQNAAMGMPMRQFGEVLSYSFEGTYEEGERAFEFVMILACIVNGLEMEMGRQVSWSIEPCFTLAAPKGELEEEAALLMTIAGSVRETPKWAKMKQDHIASMRRIAAKGAADRARINSNAAAARADSGPSVSDILHQGWKRRNAIRDGGQGRVVDSIHEVQNYSTPGSSVFVQLPSGFDNVYSNGNGDFLLTEDALYNPNVDPSFNGASWEAMKSVE